MFIWYFSKYEHWSQISLRLSWWVLRIEVCFRIQCLHYNPVSNHFCTGGGDPFVEVTVNSKEENSYLTIFVLITSKNSASVLSMSCSGASWTTRRCSRPSRCSTTRCTPPVSTQQPGGSTQYRLRTHCCTVCTLCTVQAHILFKMAERLFCKFWLVFSPVALNSFFSQLVLVGFDLQWFWWLLSSLVPIGFVYMVLNGFVSTSSGWICITAFRLFCFHRFWLVVSPLALVCFLPLLLLASFVSTGFG